MNDQLIYKLEERLLPLIKRIEQLEQGHTILGDGTLSLQEPRHIPRVRHLDSFS